MDFLISKMISMLVLFLLWFATFSVSERVALGSAFFVFIGVIGEYVAEHPSIQKKSGLKDELSGSPQQSWCWGLRATWLV